MSRQDQVLRTLLTALAGVPLGLVVAYYPLAFLALAMGKDPIHVSPFIEGILLLAVVLPILAATLLGRLAWRGEWGRGLRVIRWTGLATALMLVLLEAI